MVSAQEQPAQTIARFQARVASLERLLADRSRLLRQLPRVVCDDDLMSFSRLTSASLRSRARASACEAGARRPPCRAET
jgi:hypothetical protein